MPLKPHALTDHTLSGSEVPLLQVENLAVHYRSAPGPFGGKSGAVVRAVDSVSFTVGRGETLGLVGESGCGKSTTGRAIVGLVKPTGGTIRFEGQDLIGLEGAPLRRLRQQFQMIFQDPYASLNPRMTVRASIAEPLEVHGIGTARERKNRVLELLDLVGLRRSAAERYPHAFSGGQRQRIGIARALALNPKFVIADEPISSLDVSIQAQIINLLLRLQRRLGLASLFISHDLAAVRHISQRVMVMYLGRIVEVAASAELYRRPIHPYTVALLSAVPIPVPSVEQRRSRIILAGEMPSPADPPSGCRFRTRCWLRQRLGEPEACSTLDPVLTSVDSGHAVACHFPDKVDASAEQRRAVAGS